VDSVYSGISPQKGYSGDEDQGLMGSLAVLLKIGLFSTNGGIAPKPFYELTSPIFSKITLHLDQRYYPGKQVTIEVRNNGPENFYIQSAEWNGKKWDKPWIWHEDFVKGGKLVLVMGDKPNMSWGSAVSAAPPSMTPIHE
jgi:putative alpha-1,2-mannosidase